MDERLQKIWLIASGAVSLYESEGLDMVALFKANGREDLVAVLDTLTAALYWILEEDKHM